jgi:hypothetical protein
MTCNRLHIRTVAHQNCFSFLFKWLAIIRMCKRLTPEIKIRNKYDSQSFTHTNIGTPENGINSMITCNRSHIWMGACQKIFKWLAIVRMCDRLHARNQNQNMKWLAIVRTYEHWHARK